MKDIVYHTTIKGYPLIKFQTKDIIEKTVGGEFYMNSLRYYRELYKKRVMSLLVILVKERYFFLKDWEHN